MTSKGLRPALCALSGVVVAVACQSDAWIGAERPAPSDAAVSESGPPPMKPPDGAPECEKVMCGNRMVACGDCEDNDHDGKIDMDDPECLGPCQTVEDSFANPMPGQGHGMCRLDCYFDQDDGFGNDDCVYSHKCDVLSQPPDYPPEGVSCAYNPDEKLPQGRSCTTPQTEKCVSVCKPLTPNGCDCFGCCKIPGTNSAVFIGSVDDADTPTCDSAHITDMKRCKPCTPVDSCLNDCKECELCFGKRVLPPGCGQEGPACAAPECPPSSAGCGLECLPACTTGRSCITGCCTEPPR
jgi:hypothetical protein